MAVRALSRRHRVRTGQGPAGLRVIEFAVSPGHGVVAGFAGQGQAGLDVIYGTNRVVVVLLVAGNARGLGKVVIVIDVAIGAGARRHGVAAGERELGFVVIELGRLPGAGRVACFTSLWEAALHMVRIVGVLEILQMARDARSLSQVVVIVDVAIGALARGNAVAAGERESGLGVIEVRRRPGRRGVARLACFGESLLRVVRVIGVLKILQMAGDAGGLGQVVVIVDMAIGARTGRHGVSASEEESSECVIEPCVQPVIGRVARFACSSKFSGHVVGVFGGLKIFLVATQASRRHGIELAERAVLVAVFAGHRRVRAGQREAVHVLIDLLDRNLPAADGVAGLASRAHLALVNVGVAVSAFVADVAEDHLGVAGSAGDAFVHAAQRIASLLVIELGHGTDRLPAIDSVAVLARHIEVAVRAPRVLCCLGRRAENGRRQQQPPDHPLCDHDGPSPGTKFRTEEPSTKGTAQSAKSNRVSNKSRYVLMSAQVT